VRICEHVVEGADLIGGMMIWPEVIRINRASWHDEVSRSHRYRGVMSSSLLDKPNYLLAGMKSFLRALVVGKRPAMFFLNSQILGGVKIVWERRLVS
jgi:hypothetical protein